MKICEVCGGMGHAGTLLCYSCNGTGSIMLGHEQQARYDAMVAAARDKAARLGWMEEVWEGTPGNFRKVRRPVQSLDDIYRQESEREAQIAEGRGYTDAERARI